MLEQVPVLPLITDAPRVSADHSETSEPALETAPRKPARSRGRGKAAKTEVMADGVVGAADMPAETAAPVSEAAVADTETRAPRRDRGPRPDRAPRTDREPRADREPRQDREPRAEREARPNREPRNDRKPEAQAPAARPAASEPELRSRGVQAVRPRDDDDRRVVGFGGELPAFLARPLPKRAPVKDSDDT